MNLFPDLCAAGKSAPVHADQTDKTIALVDGHEVVLRDIAYTVHEKRLDVRLHRLEFCVLRHDLLPSFEAKTRFSSASWAWIHGKNPACSSIAIEEGEIDGNHERLPLQVTHLKIYKPADAPWNTQVVGAFLSTEENRAAVAGANDLTFFGIEQMLVDRLKRRAAELTTLLRLSGSSPARELPQEGGGCVTLRCSVWNFAHGSPLITYAGGRFGIFE